MGVMLCFLEGRISYIRYLEFFCMEDLFLSPHLLFILLLTLFQLCIGSPFSWLLSFDLPLLLCSFVFAFVCSFAFSTLSSGTVRFFRLILYILYFSSWVSRFSKDHLLLFLRNGITNKDLSLRFTHYYRYVLASRPSSLIE